MSDEVVFFRFHPREFESAGKTNVLQEVTAAAAAAAADAVSVFSAPSSSLHRAPHRDSFRSGRKLNPEFVFNSFSGDRIRPLPLCVVVKASSVQDTVDAPPRRLIDLARGSPILKRK